MKEIGIVAMFVLFLAGIIVLSFFGEEIAVARKAYFDPKYANVERETFINTDSYVRGKQQELGKLYKEWGTAEDDDQKVIIENVVVSSMGDLDADKIGDPTLRNWLVLTRNNYYKR